MATGATTRVNWTRPQTLAALHIYLQLPFGQLHQRNPKIKQLAQWIGRTPGSIALKLVNLASLDPAIVANGRSGMVQVRLNQARIRKSVLSSYNATCCISGLQHEKLVIASHTVPWSVNTKNRLNPRTGLCLCALHDRAYDQGLITVMPDFTVRVSAIFKARKKDNFIADALLRFNGKTITLPERFRP